MVREPSFQGSFRADHAPTKSLGGSGVKLTGKRANPRCDAEPASCETATDIAAYLSMFSQVCLRLLSGNAVYRPEPANCDPTCSADSKFRIGKGLPGTLDSGQLKPMPNCIGDRRN